VSDFLIARSLMALSLGFHIIFAVVGMGMPVLMTIAEWQWLRKGDPVHLDLAKRWARGTAILFAVGAASGTVLSFELGLLWPRFMEFAGGIIGMPFSLEGFAFFTEAIFLGLYLYGWDRLSPRAHWLAGAVVALSGLASAIFVVIANAWMNAPTGFQLVDGQLTDVDPIAAMRNPASFQQVTHMVLAAYVATGFAVASVHAFFLLRDRSNRFHRAALGIAVTLGMVAAPLQLVSGDRLAKMTARLQPAKFAALESHYHTESGAPLVVGGIPDDDAMHTRFAVRVPRMLSFLAHGDPGAEVTGLEEFPREDWPNTRIVHWAFDLMVACGTALLAIAAWGAWRRIRREPIADSRALLRTLVIAGPLGFIAIETGWVVTEVGRQPWIIQGIMRTRDAVTPMTGLVWPFAAFTALYVLLAVILVFVLRRQFIETAPATTTGEAA
jgi:cytochrome d ubiquinol oxidase subunit I